MNLHNIEFIVIPFLYSKYFSGSLVLGSGPGSSVGIATGYELDSPGIESRWGRDFSHLSRPALRITQPACTMGTGSFSGDKSGRGVTLTPHPFLAPWSRKSRGIPLLPLWAVRPVQSLSACTRVHFTFILYSLLFNEYQGSIPGVKRQGREVDNHLHLLPRLRMNGVIRLLPLWTVTTVKSGTMM